MSADGERWFVLNASPDIARQIGALPTRPDDRALRQSPVEAIALTDAELDHSAGLVVLRQGAGLSILATAASTAILEEDTRILPTLRAFTSVRMTLLASSATATPLSLDYRDGTASGLTLSCIPLPGEAPRFASSPEARPVALMIEDRTVVGWPTLVYAPGCAALDEETLSSLRAAECDLLLFDGTFWAEDELVRLGADRGARAMGHVPVSGPTGSLELLSRAALGCRTIYVHMNNTNPMLLEDSSERQDVLASGLEIGDDGMRVELS